jgi:hypothetical protein
MERETGLEPANGYGANDLRPQTGMKRGILKEPQTIVADDVWQCKPPANMARDAFWGQMSEALAARWEAR